MIGYLQGRVHYKDNWNNLITVLTESGLGYDVFFNEEVSVGEEVSLYITHIIKESSQELYAHKQWKEKKIFCILNDVKGVGPKMAFSILKQISMESLMDAIFLERKEILKKVQGIGDKLAKQIIWELSSKKELFDSILIDVNVASADQKQTESTFEDERFEKQKVISDVLSATKSLGLDEPKCLKILKDFDICHYQNSEVLLKDLLKKYYVN